MRETLGEFEQLVLLAVLSLEDDAFAAEIRRRIETAAERSVSRGALYATLDRLEAKGFLGWEAGARRRFVVTREGVAALRRSLEAVKRLTRGLERRIGSA
ncbi:MAG: helix-turn-helix transcriptional regulator [Gemmatimonadales bacterium]